VLPGREAHARAAAEPDRFRVIDAAQPVEAVVADVTARLREFLAARA
jgi:thymidylate kinase